MANRIIRRAERGDDRRAFNRVPIERDIRYKLLGGRRSEPVRTGLGRMLDMSSGGVQFTTESPLPAGERVELAVNWPARLNNVTPLKLVILGTVVRAEATQAAIRIEQYEFKTLGSAGL
jgi:hypothetical protein